MKGMEQLICLSRASGPLLLHRAASQCSLCVLCTVHALRVQSWVRL